MIIVRPRSGFVVDVLVEAAQRPAWVTVRSKPGLVTRTQPLYESSEFLNTLNRKFPLRTKLMLNDALYSGFDVVQSTQRHLKSSNR